MTLQEQITKAAEEYALDVTSIEGRRPALTDAYTAGATEALSNPDLYQQAGLGKREEWISVKDRLPDFGEYVLVNIGEDTVLKGSLKRNGWTAFYLDGENLADHDLRPVTHWMPLPKPPTP